MNMIAATAELNAFPECPVGAITARSLKEKAGKQCVLCTIVNIDRVHSFRLCVLS